MSITKLRLIVFAALVMTVFYSNTAFAAEPYIHDPMANPNAAKDIIVNPSAVYGYSPSPESSRLKDYVDYDWTDSVVVNEMKQQREEYHDSMKELYSMIATMKAAGSDVKDIAIAVSTRRNELRLETYKDDPEGLAKVKKNNLENFGNENGGTPEFFYKKYGSWETVIEKALSANAGADACLGLYDKYYDTYFISQADTIKSNALKSDTSLQSSSDASCMYTVKPGDTLSSIAADVLGDGTKWRDIYDGNKDLIKDPNKIYAGQMLTI